MCEFHQYGDDVPATHKCEKCGSPPCLMHMEKYRRYGGMDRADDIYELCPECNEKTSVESKAAFKKVAGFGGIMMIGMIAVFVIIVGGIIAVFNSISENSPF